jgi:excisionase family DNA binding protein
METMKMTKPTQPLKVPFGTLSSKSVVRYLDQLHIIRARCDLFQSLLEARLANPMSDVASTVNDELLTIPEVARVLKVSRPRAYELARSGTLPSRKVGIRQVRVPRRDLDRYLSGQNRH